MKTQEWYASLMGKEIIYISYDQERIPAIVTGINYHLGYTIQASGNTAGPRETSLPKGTYLSCYRGPMSPGSGGRAKSDMIHRRRMTIAAQQIREGVYNAPTMDKCRRPETAISLRGPSAATCAFAQ